MPSQLERIMFMQGGRCFFCRSPLDHSNASVEHLVATSKGGGNDDENCVACCKALNSIFGAKSIKEKIGIILNQQGNFHCPSFKPPKQ